MKLSDRVKRYESVFDQRAVIRTPLMIRVDGKSFSTLTRKCNKPFDDDLASAMVKSAVDVAKNLTGFKAAYVQSDEVTFCITDYDTINTQGYFDYRINKIVSVTASYMTAYFNWYSTLNNFAMFDCRAFSVPISDVSNVFLWRAKDWFRNSIQMYARSFFSNKELLGKNHGDIHEMLYSIGKNWSEDLTPRQKNGTFILNNKGVYVITSIIEPYYDDISSIIQPLIKRC